jgi:carbamoyl-phosphate synthase large subunit
LLVVRNCARATGILPVVKQIDTLAAEYPAQTNYLYLTYAVWPATSSFSNDHRSVDRPRLGCLPHRQSSVEFDWCGVQALNTIRKEWLPQHHDQLQPGDRVDGL